MRAKDALLTPLLTNLYRVVTNDARLVLMPLSNAERQRLYIRRLKAKAAAVTNGRQPGTRSRGRSAQPLPPIITNDLSAAAKIMLKRLARHRGCSFAALIERWATAAEHRVVARLKGKALKTYYEGK
jgi:hypothetical protein